MFLKIAQEGGPPLVRQVLKDEVIDTCARMMPQKAGSGPAEASILGKTGLHLLEYHFDSVCLVLIIYSRRELLNYLPNRALSQQIKKREELSRKSGKSDRRVSGHFAKTKIRVRICQPH